MATLFCCEHFVPIGTYRGFVRDGNVILSLVSQTIAYLGRVQILSGKWSFW